MERIKQLGEVSKPVSCGAFVRYKENHNYCKLPKYGNPAEVSVW